MVFQCAVCVYVCVRVYAAHTHTEFVKMNSDSTRTPNKFSRPIPTETNLNNAKENDIVKWQ